MGGHDNDAQHDPVQAMIGDKLRSMYEEVLAEPIPDKLVQLLVELDDKTSDEPGPPDSQNGNEQQ